MAVSFAEIGSNILVPGVYAEFDPSRASSGLAAQPHVGLVVGQITAGSVGLQLVESSDGAEFGADSQLAAQIKAFRASDNKTELWAYAFADPAGAITGDVDFTGTATESGEIALYIAGRRISVLVASGDAALDVSATATAAVADYVATKVDLPVTGAQDVPNTGVDLTAVHTGNPGLQVVMGVNLAPGEKLPAGITVNITQMNGSGTEVDYDTLVTALGDQQFNSVGLGASTKVEVDKLITEFEDRWGPDRPIDGQLFAAVGGTQGSLTTYGNLMNSQVFTGIGHEVSALMRPSYEIAAAVAGESAKQVQIDPARPYTDLPLSGFRGAHTSAQFTSAQRQIILSDGMSTLTADRTGQLKIERLVTTYQLNSGGQPDTAYQDLSTVTNLSNLRFTLRAYISTKYPRHKLMDDGNVVPAGQAIVTPSTIRASIIELSNLWYDRGQVENLEQFAEDLIVERNGGDPNRVDAVLVPDLINAFLVSANKISFIR